MRREGVQEEGLYSIRMHASSEKGHLCGAERIVPRGLIPLISETLLGRAWKRRAPGPASISIRVDAVDTGMIRTIPLLPVRTVQAGDPSAAESQALALLVSAGVSERSARGALCALGSGASPDGRNMRGGMIIHAETGERLEPDPARGVRVSHMDVAEAVREDLQVFLRSHGLQHPRVMEAVILASKVAWVPGLVAEVCRSDDPGYTTGYVASRELGYVRILNMKRPGDTFGGRAFFVDGHASIERIMEELEDAPYLISEIP